MIDSGTTKLFRPTRKDSARYSMLFHKITGIQIKPTTTGPPLRSFGWSHINEAQKCIIIIHVIYSQNYANLQRDGGTELLGISL